MASEPLCGTAALGTIGECRKCSNDPNQEVEGTGTMRGTCALEGKRCKQSGECKCQAQEGQDGDPTDNNGRGTCPENMFCCTDGNCVSDNTNCS